MIINFQKITMLSSYKMLFQYHNVYRQIVPA